MSRMLIFGILLSFGLLTSSSYAQDKKEELQNGPPYPGESDITFEWDYSCPNGKNCSFNCTGVGGASHVTKLVIYLGTIQVGKAQNLPSVLYEFSTQEIPRGNGFSVNTGVNTLSCQVNGLALNYSGPPREFVTAATKHNAK